jgi:Spy/CpxP family protein refolding chaperone
MNKLIAALGFSTALMLSPALAQTAAPAPDAPMAAPMMHHHHHRHHHHHKAMMKPLADAPKS